MDRLIALVGLRFKSDLRALFGARERVWAWLAALPFALLFSLAGALLAYVLARGLAVAHPEALLPLGSLLATATGLLWMISPLMAGAAFAESHDLTRLLHFPLRPALLVSASLIANLVRPMVLGELPALVALALAVAPQQPLAALAGLGASLLFLVTAAQAANLALHGLSRHRRLHDALLFAGLTLGSLLSLAPFLALGAGGRTLGRAARALFEGPLPACSPFGWGVRAAVHAGRGEWHWWLLGLLGSLGATLLVLLASGALALRIYRGEVHSGTAAGTTARAGRLRLPGSLGALIEKDLRLTWREPALKSALLMSLLLPAVLLMFVLRRSETGVAAATPLLVATFLGAGGMGGNLFGLERRGLTLLFGFPVARWRLLVAKNVAASVWRGVGWVALAVVGFLTAPATIVVAALVVLLVTLLVAAGVDNFVSVLFPEALPAPGRNPYRGGAGGRGLLGVVLHLAALIVVLLLSSPFAFLAWLPLLAGQPQLWWLTLPLALAGAGAAYAMLVAGAAGVLQRREPELLERVLGEV